uniref:Uncharacterized protein n=1 Tax=Chelonoidis abingdonii TaxID=106734 RepID=A0A8C0G0X6_CHEAB
MASPRLELEEIQPLQQDAARPEPAVAEARHWIEVRSPQKKNNNGGPYRGHGMGKKVMGCLWRDASSPFLTCSLLAV